MVYPQPQTLADTERTEASMDAAALLTAALPVADSGGARGRRHGGTPGDPLAIHHPTLAAVVAEKLRQLIIDGTLVPGVWLNERELCERLQVSRTPLREAYRILSADGLVMLLPKRGAQVIALSARDVGDLFDVLAVLEGLMGRLAAERATDAELAHIGHLHRAMLEAYAARDLKRYYEASMGTHVAISAAAHNPALEETYRRLNLRVQSLRYQSNLDRQEWAHGVDDHEHFVAALLARDAEAAERLMREHALDKKAAAVRQAREREG